MAPPIPIDLTQIVWTNGRVTHFEVKGEQSATWLLQEDPATALAVAHRAEVAHDPQKSLVIVFLYLDIFINTGHPPQPTGISGHFELDFTFSVANLPELLVTSEQAKPQLPPQLVLLLTSVAYSTARGILWTRLAGTPLEGITLPLIDPRQLLQPAPPIVPLATATEKRRVPARSAKKKPD